MIDGVTTVYLDTETTGLSPHRDEIVQIAVCNDNGQAIINSYIRPNDKKMTEGWPQAALIHGIRPSMVAGAPTIDEVTDELIAAISGRRVVIYNAQFDFPFLPTRVRNSAVEACCAMLTFAAAPSHRKWNNYHKDWRWWKLKEAAAAIGYSWKGRTHDALADALACRAVWRYCLAQNLKLKIFWCPKH